MHDDENENSAENDEERTPWFGPKPFGFGYRPQTWQGFLVVAALLVYTVRPLRCMMFLN